MRKDAHFEKYEMFINAGCLAAQANFSKEGFRQRDVKFMIEMFSNWIDIVLPDQVLEVHNTQIMRFLQFLNNEGFTRKNLKSETQRYRLTRSGIMYLLQRLVERPPQFPIEHFYFIYHFLETYAEPITELIRAEGKEFPLAMRQELKTLLDVGKPLRAHIEYLEREVSKLKERISDSGKVSRLVDLYEQKELSMNQLIKKIDEEFPYDLNSQKSITDFYGEIPEGIRDFILKVALKKRTTQMWLPVREVMEVHLKNLIKLQENLKNVG